MLGGGWSILLPLIISLFFCCVSVIVAHHLLHNGSWVFNVFESVWVYVARDNFAYIQFVFECIALYVSERMCVCGFVCVCVFVLIKSVHELVMHSLFSIISVIKYSQFFKQNFWQLYYYLLFSFLHFFFHIRIYYST